MFDDEEKMKGAQVIALGFLNDTNSLLEVMKATCDFIGRKLDKKEFNAIKRMYKQHLTMLQFYGKPLPDQFKGIEKK